MVVGSDWRSDVNWAKIDRLRSAAINLKDVASKYNGVSSKKTEQHIEGSMHKGSKV